MKRILFVCHGNICRSPMAEFVMKDLVEKAGLSGQFEIASAATSTEEIGNPIYPPARRKLAEHGISCADKTARQMTRRDYETYDYVIAMDHNNLRNMTRFVGSDPDHKVSLMMDHTRRPGDVADPWYTGDFEATWQDVLEGCTSLLEKLLKKRMFSGRGLDSEVSDSLYVWSAQLAHEAAYISLARSEYVERLCGKARALLSDMSG